MSRVAVAAASQLAADAGRLVGEAGGNAVDCALAAVLVAMISEPGVCALGAGGFVTVGPAGEQAITVDGNVAMPGIGLAPSAFGHRRRVAELAYGGGVVTTIGYESVAVPGGVAALGTCWRRYGSVPWDLVVAPAVEAAAAGFPLSTASHEYLTHSHEVIFGWDPASHAAVHHPDGRLLAPGETVVVDGLADTLRILAAEGAETLYTGSLAQVIVADFAEHGGLITAADLAGYTAEVRPAVATRLGRWSIATNPPPSVGGPALLAMLELAAAGGGDLAAVLRAQAAVMRYRAERLDLAEDLTEATARLLSELAGDGLAGWLSAPSTVHVSSVDRYGTACSVTMSAGYGSGVIPPGTGIWMNNSLGEEELNRRGFHSIRPGDRLPSNMAPTVARRSDGAVLAIGSPGADRITTALQQTILGVALEDRRLEDAIGAPRAHVELAEGGWRVAHEPGIDVAGAGFRARPFDGLNMYFGGVTAAGWGPERGLVAAADPRRTGGIATA